MQHAIKLKYVSLAAFLLFALGMALPAFADTEDMSPEESTGENSVEIENTNSEEGSDDDDLEESEDDEQSEDDSDDDDDDEEKAKKEKCEGDHKNVGQKVRCEVHDRNEERKEHRSEVKEMWHEFGKTTDRAELQSQLRQLMTMLIELLTKQMALTGSDS